MNSIDDLLRNIDAFVARIEQESQHGMVAGMLLMEGDAKVTDAYENDTGATRLSTVGYVAGVNDERFAEAAALAASRNPDHVARDTAPAAPDGTVRGILTAPTDYAIDQEQERGGNNAWIAPTIQGSSRRAFDRAIQQLREVFGG